MAIYDIKYINEFFFKKKKKQSDQKDKDQKKIEIPDDLKKNIDKLLKDIVRKYNTDKQLIDDSMKELEEYFEDFSDGWDNKYHKMGCDLLESDKYYLSYDLSPSDSGNYDVQSYNSALIDVRRSICKELNNHLARNIKATADNGDGDEGIIEIFGFE